MVLSFIFLPLLLLFSCQVLDVSSDNIFTALRHAQQVGMMTEPYSYLVTSLDLQSTDLEDFKFSRTKISGLRLIDTESSGNYIAPLHWYLFALLMWVFAEYHAPGEREATPST